MRSASIRLLGAAAAGAVLLAAPAAASAFCGFYVSGAGADLYNDATQVVLMREGTRTVLSMQNNYQGPPSDFAMVVPVPVVLKKENVKTLPHEIFARVDKLGAPRLVEYWEQDPCAPPEPEYDRAFSADPAAPPAADEKGGGGLGVKIEAQFKVGEYDVVILSARDSTGLDTWLRKEKYKIPEGAEPYLKPYVASGSKFFVAKVDIEKVKTVDGRLTLSPLRFHYDAEEFSLPIRLGMMNSSGKQDLIVNVLAPATRYELSNYPNVTIPTNLDVREEARSRFGEFYAALFDRTLEKNSGAVVTEYAWDASSCDPCPEPPLEPGELMTLGGDVIGGGQPVYNFVLTRLHARYGKDDIREDLVFRGGKPIVGGREVRDAGGKLEESSVPSGMNNFQGRYAIRHEWTGPVACASPRRGIWGGPPAGQQQVATGTQAATGTAFAKRGAVQLAQIVRSDVPQIGLQAQDGGAKPEVGAAPAPTAPSTPATPTPPRKEKHGCSVGGGDAGTGWLCLVGFALIGMGRRQRRVQTGRFAALGGLAAAVALGSCSVGGSKERPASEHPAPIAQPAPPILPRSNGEAEPAQADLGAVAGITDGTTLADVDTCGGCHADVFAQQQSSPHAYSSFNNPVYRVAVDRVRKEAGLRASRMCASCHDIALLADGAMDREVEPEDARAHAGVTCRVCHGIGEARRDGNGSYALKRTAILLPREGDPASVDAHRKSAAPLRTAEMCGSCHRSFLNDLTGNPGVFLTGQDDFGAWLGTPFNKAGLARVDDAIDAQDCIGCHMPAEKATLGDAAAQRDGVVASHRVLGGHTWLSQMIGEPDQLARQREFLKGSVSIDVSAARDGAGTRTFPADGAPVRPGDTMELDVVLRNQRVGHRFPAGVLDAQDSWIEVSVRDAGGRLLARAGGQQAVTGDDPTAHVLRSLVVGDDALPRFLRQTHEFRAPVVNHTMAPRDAIAVRYRLRVPPKVAQPLAVEARLVHRSRNLPLQREACKASREARGVRFSRRAAALGDPTLDPCAAQPVTVMGETTAWIGEGWEARAAAGPAPRPLWRRRYELGMALNHALQEDLEEARAPLMAALDDLEKAPGIGSRERAMVLLALGQLEGMQGRTDAAVAWLDRAEAEMPGHPAIAFARGQAFARVWRWPEAADAFAAAMAKAAANAPGWAQLAIAMGSAGREVEALAAAQRGLALAPRNADLLRVQALALRALGADPGEAEAALQAYDQFRSPDRAADLRIACTTSSPLCAAERDPIHVHELVAPPR